MIVLIPDHCLSTYFTVKRVSTEKTVELRLSKVARVQAQCGCCCCCFTSTVKI